MRMLVPLWPSGGAELLPLFLEITPDLAAALPEHGCCAGIARSADLVQKFFGVNSAA